MSVYDVIMLVIFLGSVWFGFRKGLAWQIASVAAILVSYFVAIEFRGPVASLISAQEPWNQFAAMLLLFLGTSLIVWTIYGSVSKSIKKMELGGFDRQAGAILGAFKGAILCMLVTVFAVSLFESTQSMVHNSKAGHYVVSGIRQFSQFTPDELAGYLDPHLESFNEAIGETPAKRPIFGGDETNQPSSLASPNDGSRLPGFNIDNIQQSAGNAVDGFINDTANAAAERFGLGNQSGSSNESVFSNAGFSGAFGGAFGSSNTAQPQSQQQPQSQPIIRTGQNGWPEIDTTINAKDLLNRGAETVADRLRRAYESSGNQ